MEAFFNPHAEKQENVINAALEAFGRNGYKKTSLSDIAEKAGVAKGMINYYFGSKKNLYLYLADLCGKSMTAEIEKGYDANINDFFDNLKMMTNIKIEMIKNHPAILKFLTNLYLEEDQEVREKSKVFISSGMEFRERFMFQDIDISRFKDDVDPKLIDKLLVWAAEGLTNNLRQDMGVGEIEEFISDLYACLDLMKKHFYK